MASAAQLKARLKAKQDAAFGAPADAVVQDKTLTVMAEAIYEFLSVDVQVNIGIPVATTGGPTAQTGATTAPGALS